MVPSRVTIRERGIVLTSTLMLCVISCWRALGCADVSEPVPGLSGPDHLPGGGHLPARSRPAQSSVPDAG
jgi:hypothetical protein